MDFQCQINPTNPTCPSRIEWFVRNAEGGKKKTILTQPTKTGSFFFPLRSTVAAIFPVIRLYCRIRPLRSKEWLAAGTAEQVWEEWRRRFPIPSCQTSTSIELVAIVCLDSYGITRRRAVSRNVNMLQITDTLSFWTRFGTLRNPAPASVLAINNKPVARRFHAKRIVNL